MTDCIAWDGTHRKHDGRPVLKRKYAYRVLWEEINGPLDPNTVLHHTCENKWCVNPEHLESMSQAEHLHKHGLPGDWGQSSKTHCPSGHEYNEENTYVYKRKDGSTERHCRLCRQATKKRYQARRKQQ